MDDNFYVRDILKYLHVVCNIINISMANIRLLFLVLNGFILLKVNNVKYYQFNFCRIIIIFNLLLFNLHLVNLNPEFGYLQLFYFHFKAFNLNKKLR